MSSQVKKNWLRYLDEFKEDLDSDSEYIPLNNDSDDDGSWETQSVDDSDMLEGGDHYQSNPTSFQGLGPRPAALSRVRKPLPHRDIKKTRSHFKSDPKNVTPEKRLEEFPGHSLSIENNKLFCQCCNLELTTKVSTVKRHLFKCGRHTVNLRAYNDSLQQQ